MSADEAWERLLERLREAAEIVERTARRTHRPRARRGLPAPHAGALDRHRDARREGRPGAPGVHPMDDGRTARCTATTPAPCTTQRSSTPDHVYRIAGTRAPAPTSASASTGRRSRAASASSATSTTTSSTSPRTARSSCGSSARSPDAGRQLSGAGRRDDRSDGPAVLRRPGDRGPGDVHDRDGAVRRAAAAADRGPDRRAARRARRVRARHGRGRDDAAARCRPRSRTAVFRAGTEYVDKHGAPTDPPVDASVVVRVMPTPAIQYSGSWFDDLDDDEVLVIEGTVPTCRYWSVQLLTRFMESGDWLHAPVFLSGKDIAVDTDGTFRIDIAHRDPGRGNWIDDHRADERQHRGPSAQGRGHPRRAVPPRKGSATSRRGSIATARRKTSRPTLRGSSAAIASGAIMAGTRTCERSFSTASSTAATNTGIGVMSRPRTSRPAPSSARSCAPPRPSPSTPIPGAPS